MGVIRGILLVVVAVLFFFSVILVSLFWTLNLSLNYDNVQKESTIVLKDILQQDANFSSIISASYPLIQTYCQLQNNSNYVFNSEGYTFDIPCSSMSQGERSVIDEGIKSLIHRVYYTGYDCDFLNCFSKYPVPLFLISEKAYNYWHDKFYWILGISAILLVLIFLLVEKKTNTFILSGILVIISALPFIKLDSIMSMFSNKIIFKFLEIFFSQAYTVSIRIIIAGIALLAIGIVFDVFKLGFSISAFFSKIKEKREEAINKKNNQKNMQKQKKNQKSK